MEPQITGYTNFSFQHGASDPAEHAGAGSPAVQGEGCRPGVAVTAQPALQHPAGVGHGPWPPHGPPGWQVGRIFPGL